MNCKDCLHYKLCRDNDLDYDDSVVIKSTSGECLHFNERSEWVHLPCKVGDTVYSFCDTFGVILPYFIENFAIGFLDKDRNYWLWEANSHAKETDELLDEIDFDLDDIGKTVFLTREEAEKALEEKK